LLLPYLLQFFELGLQRAQLNAGLLGYQPQQRVELDRIKIGYHHEIGKQRDDFILVGVLDRGPHRRCIEWNRRSERWIAPAQARKRRQLLALEPFKFLKQVFAEWAVRVLLERAFHDRVEGRRRQRFNERQQSAHGIVIAPRLRRAYLRRQ